MISYAVNLYPSILIIPSGNCHPSFNLLNCSTPWKRNIPLNDSSCTFRLLHVQEIESLQNSSAHSSSLNFADIGDLVVSLLLKPRLYLPTLVLVIQKLLFYVQDFNWSLLSNKSLKSIVNSNACLILFSLRMYHWFQVKILNLHCISH